MSLDGTETHMQQSAKLRLPYPLISDSPHGLNSLFGNHVFWMSRATYVVSSEGQLVCKYESAMLPEISDPYKHVMTALTKVQELAGLVSTSSMYYTGATVDLCAEVCDITPGGQITIVQSGEPDATALLDGLPSFGGPSRPAVADMGTHVLELSHRTVSLFAMIPTILSSRFMLRESMSGRTHTTLRKGAFDAPDPTQRIAVVFTFVCDLGAPGGGWAALGGMGGGDEDPSFLESEGGHGFIESQFTVLARGALEAYGGYECQEVGAGNLMIAFAHPIDAIRYSLIVQKRVGEKIAKTCGPKDVPCGVKIGIACGIPTYGKPHVKTGRQE